MRDGFIYASLVGKAKIEREQLKNEKSPSQASLPVVSIKTLKDNVVVIPHVGSLVVARVNYIYYLLFVYLNLNNLIYFKVTSVNPRYAKCTILAVNNAVIKENFRGQIKYLCVYVFIIEVF